MAILRSAALPTSRWPNGAGRKADIATGDGWMVGFAWLDEDAPFSVLPGRDRTITLVEGPGFSLDVAGTALTVDAPFRPTAFDGGAPTRCRIAGPCRVLNVMTERGRLRHEVSIGPPGPLDAAGCVAAFAVLLQGAASLDGAALAPLDAVAAPARLDGTGLVYAVRITTA